jgi:hypothetical protein
MPRAVFIWTTLVVAVAADRCVVGARVSAAEFDVRQYGATANDASDDTQAICKTLEACAAAEGGTVFIPAGTYLISRQKSESPILELPSNTVLRGEGPASVLKFDPRVNQSNFWRMLGAGGKDCRNVVVRDLHLDGSNTHPKYVKGETPEHNHGVFLYREGGVVENVTLQDLLVENFSGDCIGLGHGCRNITIRGVTLRNFVRQGIQLGGGSGARDYLVTGCQDLEGTVEPGGSTLHVEHARGLTGVILADNRCRHSILAGGVDGLVIRGNLVAGRIEGNYDCNTIVQGNVVRAVGGSRPLIQFGFADGLVIRDNALIGGDLKQIGIYVWGTSHYDPQPSRHVSILDNVIRTSGPPISLNGVQGGLVRDNVVESVEGRPEVLANRCEKVTVVKRDQN